MDDTIEQIGVAIEALKVAHSEVVRVLKEENEELKRRLALLEAQR